MLSYWSGQESVVVAVPSLGRNVPQLQSAVGYFVNMLPICCKLDASWSGTELLSAARDSMRQAQANADVPFLEIMRAVRPTRDASTTPIFQAMLAPAEADAAAEAALGVPQEVTSIRMVRF